MSLISPIVNRLVRLISAHTRRLNGQMCHRVPAVGKQLRTAMLILNSKHQIITISHSLNLSNHHSVRKTPRVPVLAVHIAVELAASIVP